MTHALFESPKISQKRPRPSTDFYESLMCMICTDFFKPPVVQCSKGHSYCQACVKKMTTPQSREKVCAVCRSSMMSGVRNYAIEEILSKFSVPCIWADRGCTLSVKLDEKEEHEEKCEFRPLITCYYQLTHNCDWKGRQELLADHLIKVHEVQELSRSSLFRYLWNPPSKEVWRYRYRVLKQVIGIDCEPFTFVLEHYYCPDTQLLCFLLRSVITEVRKKYRISVLNRENEENKICFEGITCDFDEFGQISNFLNEDLSKVMILPLQQLESFCFFCQEDNTSYFSLHIHVL